MLKTYEEYQKQILENGNASMFARDSYSEQVVPIPKSTLNYDPVKSSYAFNPNLDTPEGLYKLASSIGMKEGADRAVERAGGESQRFLSGGWFMDVMDILNIGSYGIVGMVKGKGFIEGVKNRESLSDDDSLGKYGWQGKIAGFIGDIVLDPFTYLAPMKLVTKVPGIVKGAKFAKSKLVGDLTPIVVDGQTTFERVGGWSPLKVLGNKLIYGFAVDRKYLDAEQQIIGRTEAMAGDADNLIGIFSKMDPELMKKTLSKDDTGRFISTPLDQLQRELSPAQTEVVSSIYKMRDEMMDRLTDLGVISRETRDEHWETYLKQTYTEYLDAKKRIPGKKGVALESKGRKTDLDEETMKKLGQVEDPAVIWGTTLLKQVDLIRKAELQKLVADNFSLTKDQLDDYVAAGGSIDNLYQVPDSSLYKFKGREIDITKSLGDVSKNLKKVLSARRAALADEKELVSTISRIEKKLDSIVTLNEKDLSEALSGLKAFIRESGQTLGPVKKVATSEGQKLLALDFKKWLNRGSKSERLARETLSTADLLEEYLKTKGGWALTRAFDKPDAMYQWKSPLEFADSIRYPNRAVGVVEEARGLDELTEAEELQRIARSEKRTREYGDLQQQREILKGTNLKLVQEAVNRLEDEYADLLFKKNNLLSALEMNEMGNLAGKYVSKDIWESLKGTFEPTAELGENLVLKFKHLKVIWNPASHARNAISAGIQNWWRLGIGPWRADIYFDAAKELSTLKMPPAKQGKYIKMMKELGFSERSGQVAELTENYLNSKLLGDTIAKQTGWTTKQIGKFFKATDRLFLKTYGHMDNVAKVAAFKYGLKKGMSPEDALKAAYEATFNYSQVTPFVHRMRRAIWGVPFITFALKAAPLVAKTAAYSPGRISVFGKARNDLFKAAGVEGEQEAEALPEYMRDDMFVMRLPWKDANGRSMYFDLSYIIPFGAIMTGEYLKNPIGSNPVLQTVKELSQNKTFAGNKIFNESDDVETVIGDVFLHVAKIGMPPFAANQFPDGYNYEGKREWRSVTGSLVGQNVQDLGPGERSFWQEMAKLAGAGVSPYDLESKERQMAYKQKENLTKLLVENDVLREFRNPYLPKDSELRPNPLLKNLYEGKDQFTR